MNFNELKTLTIGGKKVIRILRNDEIVWKFNKLPDEYRETEWIGAAPNSNAYIDLGFPFDSAAKIYMSLWLDSENSNSTYPFGATENEGALRCCLSSPYSGAGYQVFYGSTGSAYFSVSLTKSAPLWSKNDLVMTIKKGMLKLENLTTSSQTTSTNQGEYTMVNNLYLFAQNYNGSARWGSQQRQISKFSYYDKNNKLICNLIPCFRISDGEAGMYDTVRKIFLTNANAASGHKLMRGPVSYTSQNLMPLSTEADGITPYNNGLGYKDNWRVRSEGAEQEQTKISCTGFIPFTKNDKLYIYPPFTGGNTDNAINFSDSTFTNIGQVKDSGGGSGICGNKPTEFMVKLENGISVLDLTQCTVADASRIAYVRISHRIIAANGDMRTGAEMIITKNEVI